MSTRVQNYPKHLNHVSFTMSFCRGACINNINMAMDIVCVLIKFVVSYTKSEIEEILNTMLKYVRNPHPT